MLALWQPAATAQPVRSLSAGEQATYLVKGAERLYTAGKHSQAANELEAALRLDATCVEAEQLMAVTCHAQHNLSEALEHYWAVQRLALPPFGPETGSEELRDRELMVECEGLIMLLLNEERIRRGLGLCIPEPRLVDVARQHSDEMRDLRYFDHKSPTPGLRTISDRFKRVFGNVQAYSIAENIARRYSASLPSLSVESIHATHEQWMNSPGHRANILGPKFDHVGVGLSVNANGDYWATQFFAKL